MVSMYIRIGSVFTVLFSLLLILAGSLSAGPPSVTWETRIPSEFDCRLWAIDFTDDGGAIAVGEAGTADEELESLLVVSQ